MPEDHGGPASGGDRGRWRGPKFHGDYRGARGPGFRPPWWPENEPFPPTGPQAWGSMRRHFARRVFLVVAGFFGLIFAANALAVGVFSGLGRGEHRGFAPGAVILGFGLIVAVVAGGRAVRRIARPVGALMEAADRVAAGDYEARVEEQGPREMRRLARSFNAMTKRLHAHEEQRRNLLADLAHELRTPLSVIQGNAEGMLDGLYPIDRAHLEPLLEETRVMSRLLDDLHTLSRAEVGALRLHREPVEPETLVDDAASAFRGPAEAVGVSLEVRVASGLPPLEVDAVRIGQVLANLLSNAVRHTPPGGSVVASADSESGGRAVAFAVTDAGSGIPAELLPHIFDRFVKGADSSGAGLGLAIAKSLVEAHGGEITAESRPGNGTTIKFVLPSA
ncbi:MAG TPA: HAMP domain-containing sensor histidine kinase [Actinomycetota bacterium]